jgi:hypothetical protein
MFLQGLLREGIRGKHCRFARSFQLKRFTSFLNRIARTAFNREAHAFRIVVIRRVFVVTLGLAHDGFAVCSIIGGQFFARGCAERSVRTWLAERVFFANDRTTFVDRGSAGGEQEQGQGKKQNSRHAPRITKRRGAVV